MNYRVKLLVTLSVIIIAFGIFSLCFASDVPKTDWPSGNGTVGKVEPIAKNVWATVTLVVRIIAVGIVVFAGLRYMFSSSDIRADVKNGLIYLALGALLVFGATYIIEAVTKTSQEILSKNPVEYNQKI